MEDPMRQYRGTVVWTGGAWRGPWRRLPEIAREEAVGYYCDHPLRVPAGAALGVEESQTQLYVSPGPSIPVEEAPHA